MANVIVTVEFIKNLLKLNRYKIYFMKDSIVKALLFVIALGTSIIAVELIPISMVNRGKLFCAEYNS